MNYLVSRISIKGFRRLLDVDLPVGPLTVLIGANGVGKTSILEAWDLLAASAANKLNDTAMELGGVANLVTRGKTRSFSLTVALNVDGHQPLDYHLQIAANGADYRIEEETLSQKHKGHAEPLFHIKSRDGQIAYYDAGKKKLLPPSWEHNVHETSLAQVPNLYRESEALRRILSSVVHYHTLAVENNSPVKLPQAMRPAQNPGHNGENLVPFLYYLRETDKQRFECVVDAMRVIFPNLEDLSFPPVAAGMLSIAWKDRNYELPFYAHELSEGTLRFLWLVSLLQSPTLPPVTLIDEPEVSLHPEALRLLADLFREAAQRTRLLVATHSDRLVRCLRPDEIAVVDTNDDGYATITKGDQMDLKHWLRDYGLDELWQMGVLGGRI
ncbi:MAG: AAA family ATPase [Planctomycetota bacterium]|jgi:predicted ATPase|nr:AAA family ATPase [Planctomycetota bacterium]